MTDQRPYHVLFLCTSNSARSILGEVLVNTMDKDRFQGFSAGSQPAGVVHPMTLTFLDATGHDTSQLSSKSWEVFAGPDAVPLDFVFTVCDRAAQETCPVWPGQPVTAHWGIEDPVALDPGESADQKARQKPFKAAYVSLQRRLRLFMNLPLASLDRLRLKTELDRIGADGEQPQHSGPEAPD